MFELILLVLLAIVVSVVAFVALRRRRDGKREALRQRFGREYDNAVEQYGSTHAADKRLAARVHRMERTRIRPLSAAEHHRFSEMWAQVQRGFVDEPTTAVGHADRLVVQLMQTRGYPMSDFEHRVEDLSVDHGNVVQHYRAARTLAAQVERGQSTTEDLRQAMIHYRILFADLLERDERPSFSRLSEVGA